MKKVKIRETLLLSNNLSELTFDIRNAETHFLCLLDDSFPPENYDHYSSLEVSITNGGSGYCIEGTRLETDEEFANRRTIMEDKEYKKFLKLKERFGHLDG